MPNRESRTYKLCLSEVGLDHFLDCHCRVAKVARDLAPYGVTLFVALAIADTLSPGKLSAEIDAPACAALHGRTVRFVGFTGHLADLTSRLCDRLAASGRIAAPRVNRLYVAGLSCLGSADDRAIAQAYRQMRTIRSGTVS